MKRQNVRQPATVTSNRCLDHIISPYQRGELAGLVLIGLQLILESMKSWETVRC